MPTKKDISLLSPEQRQELEAWVKEHGGSLPPLVLVALNQYLVLLQVLASTTTKLKQMLSELRRALGITPSSERRVSRQRLSFMNQGQGDRPKRPNGNG